MHSPPSKPNTARQRFVFAVVPLLSVLWVMAPHVVSDADALSRLATGRWLLQAHGVPAHDPFTFSLPDARFGDPEWLGDLGLYEVFRAVGEHGLQLAMIAIAAAGYALALALGMAFGGSAELMLGLLLCTLPASAPRLSARNDVHLLWIVPLFGWLLLRCREHPRRWLGVLALGYLWSCLHASFVLGLPLLMAAAWDTRDRRHWLPWGVLLVYPLLPLLGPSGTSTYEQLLDHARGAAIYRELISEWQSPLHSSGVLAILPLHVLAALGVLSIVALLVQQRRPPALPLTMLVVGIGLAYGSRRFLPLTAAMIAPALGGLLPPLAQWPSAVRSWLRPLAWSCMVAYLGLGVRSAVHRVPASVFGGDAENVAKFLTAHAPPDSRVANAFDDGPWLLYWSAPRVRLYLDPRNNLGARWLQRYVDSVLASDADFEAEARWLGITLALVRQSDPHWDAVGEALENAPGWTLVYWDGDHAAYARDLPTNRGLIERFGYRVLKPSVDLSYLDRYQPDDARLARDLRELASQAPMAAEAIAAYRAEQRQRAGHNAQSLRGTLHRGRAE